MSSPQDTNDLLDAVAKVLLRCFVFGFLFLVLWFAIYILADGLLYRQAAMFHLTPHEVDLIHYCGMGLVKGFVLVFFLFPYIAIRLVLRKRRQ